MKRPSSHVARIRWVATAAALGCAAIGSTLAAASAPARPAASAPARLTAPHFSAAHLPRATRTNGSLTAAAGPLDPRIAGLARREPSRSIEAIVEFNPRVSLVRARSDARRAGAKTIGTLGIIHGLALRLNAAHAGRLAASPDVESVALNAAVTVQGQPGGLDAAQLQTTFDQSLNAPALWHMGGTGAHVGVAVIDTGIDGQLTDFRSATDDHSRVIATAVTNPGAQTVMDTYGHGTDVAGIVAGNGAARDRSDPLRGRYAGVAPDANLISVKVADERGNATVLDVIYGLQFAVDYRDRYHIRVVNLSLDSTAAQSYVTDPLDAAVESAWRHGIVVVVAAGNDGTATGAVQYAPANDPYVITVGAVDENGTSDPASHTIADWSSRGVTQDGFAKPDLYAPGAHIVSDLAPGSAFASMCSACIVDGQYIRTSGTSMAAPMISGLVADLLDLHPQWTPDQVKGALMSQAVWSDSLPEVDAQKVASLRSPPVADQNLTPSSLLTGADGSIDYTKSSWNKSSWNAATGSLSAGFTKSSWNCTCWDGAVPVKPTKSSWNTATWSVSSSW